MTNKFRSNFLIKNHKIIKRNKNNCFILKKFLIKKKLLEKYYKNKY